MDPLIAHLSIDRARNHRSIARAPIKIARSTDCAIAGFIEFAQSTDCAIAGFAQSIDRAAGYIELRNHRIACVVISSHLDTCMPAVIDSLY